MRNFHEMTPVRKLRQTKELVRLDFDETNNLFLLIGTVQKIENTMVRIDDARTVASYPKPGCSYPTDNFMFIVEVSRSIVDI